MCRFLSSPFFSTLSSVWLLLGFVFIWTNENELFFSEAWPMSTKMIGMSFDTSLEICSVQTICIELFSEFFCEDFICLESLKQYCEKEHVLQSLT